ncbi:MAG TPA: NAD(P)H-binding protein [Allosphingosinicella sp.]|nr:NAD(P)H-binding protein [Allosphingosinicella sp.]
MARKILLIGATGLVGRQAAGRLEAAGHDVRTLVRRPSGRASNETIADPALWPDLVGDTGADTAVCAIGTTMRAAGSQAAFRAVDHDVAVAFAAAASAAGVRHMIAVSSVGADPGSRNFYLRTKGEMEKALADLGFGRLDILRPGLLRGERGSERRPGERLGIILSPIVNLVLRGRLDRFAAIGADIVAQAIAGLAGLGDEGIFIHHNRDIRRIAAG